MVQCSTTSRSNASAWATHVFAGRHLSRLWRRRGRMPARRGPANETLRHALDPSLRRCHRQPQLSGVQRRRSPGPDLEVTSLSDHSRLALPPTNLSHTLIQDPFRRITTFYKSSCVTPRLLPGTPPAATKAALPSWGLGGHLLSKQALRYAGSSLPSPSARAIL